jgi:PAS domain S-box-containing protein
MIPAVAFESVFDALNDPVLASDARGLILYANAAAERLLGRTGSDLVGKPLTIIVPPRLRPAHEAGFHRFLTTGESRIMGRPIRVPALHRDGVEIDVELTLSELRPGPGELLVIAILRDLRERVDLERKVDAQRKIMAQYAAVTVLAEAEDAGNAMPKLLEATATTLRWEVAIYWAVDPVTKRLGASAMWSSGSAAAERFLAGCRSLTFGEGEGLPGTVLASGTAVWSRDVGADMRYLRARLAAEQGLRSALLFPVYSPKRTWGVLEYLTSREEELDEELRQTMSVLGYQIGRFLERLEREEELRRASARADAARENLEKLFEHAPAAIAILRGEEMRYELSNVVNQQLAGGREMVGKTVREALPELEADGVTAVVRHVYETGEPFLAREYPVTVPATAESPARRIFMNGVCQPLRGSDGQIEGVMVFAYDVTDLVSSRERVKETEERLRLAVESAKLGTWDYDPKSGDVRCDTRYRRLFGLGPEGDVTTGMLMAAIHPDDRETVNEAARRSFDPSAGGDYAAEYRTRGIEDGIERWVAVRGRTFFDDRGEPVRFAGTGIDVTQERRALERDRFLAEASAILSSSLEYRETLPRIAALAVPRLADWCTIELAEEATETDQLAVAHADPAKVELARELRRRYPPTRSSASGFGRVMATGEPMLVAPVTEEMLVQSATDPDHLRLLHDVGLRSAMLLPLRGREHTIGVLSLFQAESGRIYTQEDFAFGHEIAGRLAAAIENARLYDQAKKAIGIRDQFLSIASHELRTPLTSLTLQLSGLSRRMTAGTLGALPAEKLEAGVARMEQQTARLTSLVDELLDVSRISRGGLAINRHPTDLVEIVTEVIERLSDEAKRVRSTLDLKAPDSLAGDWDRNRLDQVVTNLVGNAIKHASGKPIDVELMRRGASAFITVRDRGPGISVADQKRIFEQFERAVPPTIAGLGLGLWIARRIVEAHSGSIKVESKPGEGASFIVELPVLLSS